MNPTLKAAALFALEHDRFDLARDLLNFSPGTPGGLPSPSGSQSRALEVATSPTGTVGGPSDEAILPTGLAASGLPSPSSSRASIRPSTTGIPRSDHCTAGPSRSEASPAQSSPTPVQAVPQLNGQAGGRSDGRSARRHNVAVVVRRRAALPTANSPNSVAPAVRREPASPAARVSLAARAPTGDRLRLRSHRSPQPGAAYAREWILESRMGFCQINNKRDQGTVRTWGMTKQTDFRKAVTRRIFGYGSNRAWLKAWADLLSEDGITGQFKARCVASQLFGFQPMYTASSGNSGFACDACMNQRQFCVRKLRFGREEKLVLYSLPRKFRSPDYEEQGPRRIGYYIRDAED